jgi:outer membrane protein assembly factor BamB
MRLSEKYIIILIALLGMVIFVYWLLHDPVGDMTVNLPGLDNRPLVDSSVREQVKIGEKFFNYAETHSNLVGKWSRFRGAEFDNINKENIPLIEHWGDSGPDIRWQVKLGEGHAAPVIYNGKVYILDYDEIKKADALRCFTLESGEELWKRFYTVHVKRNHGMSRTVPAINDKYLITIGPKCHVMCVNPANGDFLWGIDLVEKYGSEIPFWYTGQCPLIENDIVVLAPAGKTLLMGVDCATGNVIWETPNPDGWKMSHSSVMPMQFGGRKMYVYAAIGGIAGISAEGPDVGKILWKTTAFSPSVIAPSPLILDNGKIFFTAGYGAGSALIQLKPQGGNFSVEVLKNYKPKDGLASEQQTPLFYKGHILGIQPKDAGTERNLFVCTTVDDPANILWTSGKDQRFGMGPYLIADGKIFILDDDGTLYIAKASVSGFTLLDKARIIEGQDAWGPLALADGFLLMRDSKTLVCIDMRKNIEK